MESNLKLSKGVELSIEHVSKIVITELYLEQTLLSTLATPNYDVDEQKSLLPSGSLL